MFCFRLTQMFHQANQTHVFLYIPTFNHEAAAFVFVQICALTKGRSTCEPSNAMALDVDGALDHLFSRLHSGQVGLIDAIG